MQFAQQAAQDIRVYGLEAQGKRIRDTISMSVHTRFFTDHERVESDTWLKNNYIVKASELLMTYSPSLEEIALVKYGKYKIRPQRHGYDFQNMYYDDVRVDLVDRVIQAYHFDEKMNFAGFSIKHVKTGQVELVLAYDVDKKVLYTYEVENEIKEKYSMTRLVGFRTTKKCRSSQNILQVQPIYFSLDEDVCRNVLTEVDEGMNYELPEFGKECSDLSLMQTMKMQVLDV